MRNLYATIFLGSGCLLHSTSFTLQPIVVRRSRQSTTVPAFNSHLRQSYSRGCVLKGSLKVDAVADNLDKATDLVRTRVGGAEESELLTGKGVKPPFTVTIEGEDQSYVKAIERTFAWIGAATLFGGGLWSTFGPELGQEYFAGYLVEQSLSVDNLFVFLLLFEYFKVPQKYQDRVLNWGIFGAVVMRAIMIGVGTVALANFHEVLLVFAGILLFSSFAFFFNGNEDDDQEDLSENTIVRFSKSLYRSTEKYDGDRFFTMIDGMRTATPLLICTIAIEISDIVFAVDSIPAVFGVTEVRLLLSCSAHRGYAFLGQSAENWLVLFLFFLFLQTEPIDCLFIEHVCNHGFKKYVYNLVKSGIRAEVPGTSSGCCFGFYWQ